MTAGRLIAVVGPSGVGKDAVMAGLAAAVPGLGIARRVITRPSAPLAEDHATLDEAGFDSARAAGAFCLHWRAHGLQYGIPAAVQDDVSLGRDVLVNLSRAVLEEAIARFDRVAILSISADPETLAARLVARGRESEGEIARRLCRPAPVFPRGARVVRITNDGPLAETVNAALQGLYPGATAVSPDTPRTGT